LLLSLVNTVTSYELGYQYSVRRLKFFFSSMTVMSSQFLALNKSPVEIRTGSCLSDTKMAEREVGLTFI